MFPVTFFYLMSLFKLFWFLFSFSWNCPQRAKWVSPWHHQPQCPGRDGCAGRGSVRSWPLWGVSPGLWWTSTSHTLLKPGGKNPALAKIQGNTRQGTPTANSTSREKISLQEPEVSHGCAGGKPGCPHSWWGKCFHSLWMLAWNPKDAQCLFILLENIDQNKHNSNTIFLYLTP